MTVTYESILEKLADLAPSAAADQRKVEWLTQAQVVGLARTHDGRIEIFLSGPELEPVSRTVRDSIEHQTWHREAGEQSIDANRLLLPAAGHFDQVAAFLCTELLRNGADEDLGQAFKKAEPVIELAITRLMLSDQALLGLTGELLLLGALLGRADDDQVGYITGSWYGWRQSTRDLSLASIGVEVKTTTRATSTHHIQGVHQVELQDDPDGEGTEESLFLVSIGIQWADPAQSNTFTLPLIVDSIINRIDDALGPTAADVVETFLSHVKEYGTDREVGYDHRTMSASAVFQRPFITRFVRAYDMTDPSVEVLRSDDIVPRHHTDITSVTYRINLPNQVRGDLNPVVGLNTVAKAILG